ncbi:hypothetical protein C0J52_09529 [Blattella germanica]|nr:hypothetical protein C0J52_09529 [Blattella germanica]
MKGSASVQHRVKSRLVLIHLAKNFLRANLFTCPAMENLRLQISRLKLAQFAVNLNLYYDYTSQRAPFSSLFEYNKWTVSKIICRSNKYIAYMAYIAYMKALHTCMHYIQTYITICFSLIMGEDPLRSCPFCSANNYPDHLLICCDVCNIWFHGPCVGLCNEQVQSFAASSSTWNCPTCKIKGMKGLRIHWSRVHPGSHIPLDSHEQIISSSLDDSIHKTLALCKRNVKVMKRILKAFIASTYGAIDFVKSFHTFHGDKIELHHLSGALQEWSVLNGNLSPTASLEIQKQWDLINITRIHNSLNKQDVIINCNDVYIRKWQVHLYVLMK